MDEVLESIRREWDLPRREVLPGLRAHCGRPFSTRPDMLPPEQPQDPTLAPLARFGGRGVGTELEIVDG